MTQRKQDSTAGARPSIEAEELQEWRDGYLDRLFGDPRRKPSTSAYDRGYAYSDGPQAIIGARAVANASFDRLKIKVGDTEVAPVPGPEWAFHSGMSNPLIPELELTLSKEHYAKWMSEVGKASMHVVLFVKESANG